MRCLFRCESENCWLPYVYGDICCDSSYGASAKLTFLVVERDGIFAFFGLLRNERQFSAGCGNRNNINDIFWFRKKSFFEAASERYDRMAFFIKKITDNDVQNASKDKVKRERTAKFMIEYSWRITGTIYNHADRSDVQQEICFRTMKGINRGDVRSVKALMKYMSVVKKNYLADESRKRKRRGVESSLDQLNEEKQYEVPDRGASVDCRADVENMKRALKNLEAKEPIMSEVVIGRMILGSSRKELAERFDISERTVDRRLQEGMERLLQLLSGDNNKESSQ